MDLPAWVREARQLPLACGQVRHDPLQERELVRRLDRPARVLLPASGGCTAALLAADPRVRELDLVDPHPAQLALTRLKLRLLQEPPAERAQLLGHTPCPLEARAERLTRLLEQLMLPAQVLGPGEALARLGPDYLGRQERAWAALRARLRDQQFDLRALVELRAPDEQARRVRPEALLGAALARACRDTFAPAHVAALADGLAVSVVPAGEALLACLQQVLTARPAAGNPWLWQLLIGRHPPGVAAPWLELPARAELPPVRWHATGLLEALEAGQGPWDLIVLEAVDPAAARETLAHARRRLTSGGLLLVRGLDPGVDPAELGPGLAWDAEGAQRLNEEGRAVLGGPLHVGRAS